MKGIVQSEIAVLWISCWISGFLFYFTMKLAWGQTGKSLKKSESVYRVLGLLMALFPKNVEEIEREGTKNGLKEFLK